MLSASHAGSWYPGGEGALNSMLDDALRSAKFTPGAGTVRAIVVPHAGYRYCVKTSMHAFAQIDPALYDKVIVLGPSHRVAIRCCTIADAKVAECPLGNIEFDAGIVSTLLSKHGDLFEKLDLETAELEHSLEMEFPLLRYIFKDKKFTIVPIMCGRMSPEKAAAVASALGEVTDDRTLLVISSDFCHWGARFGYQYLPEGGGAVHERIARLDREGTEKISTGDPNEFWKYIERTKNTICGRIPILIMMNLFRNGKTDWPAYSHSSDITSKDDSCVSYMAGVLRTA